VDLTDQLPEIQSDSNLEAIKRPSLNVGYLGLNPSYEPLETRGASGDRHCHQQTGNCQAFWGEMGKSDPHFTPPSLEFQSDTVVDYQYNPQQAKQLLISWLPKWL